MAKSSPRRKSKHLKDELQKALALKTRQREALGALSFERKYEIVRDMQRRHGQLSGKPVRIWPALKD